jgi:hypothetical protein
MRLVVHWLMVLANGRLLSACCWPVAWFWQTASPNAEQKASYEIKSVLLML